jgi:hypothetical protein
MSFYYKDLRPKKKLLQFTQRITNKFMAGIGEPMVPTFGGLANIDPHEKYWFTSKISKKKLGFFGFFSFSDFLKKIF